MNVEISAYALHQKLNDGDEIAVIDVREYGEYGSEHLLFCTPIPFSRYELELPRLIPNREVRLVIYDQCDNDIARRSAFIAEALGYQNVIRLQGGIDAWKESGYGVFAGVHVPSKTLGEMVESSLETPSVSAEDLVRWQKQGKPVVVLDGRPWEEYRVMNIPGSISCPNGELIYRIQELVYDSDTRIVVNCAGRTRSIIGCEMLRQFGVENPVYALRNGTMGWRLAGLELEYGSARRAGIGLPKADSVDRRQYVVQKAESAGVVRKQPEVVRQWLNDKSRTTYLLDVRDPREYAEHHLVGAVSAPGGQLIQATETFVGVRGSRLVLVDNDELRAAACAFWLIQMGYEVVILAGGKEAWWAVEQGRREIVGGYTRISSLDLACELADDQAPMLFDCQSSTDYSRAHIDGAIWIIRSRIKDVVAKIDRSLGVCIVGRNDGVDHLVATDFAELGFRRVAVLDGGVEAWLSAKQPVVETPDFPPEDECVDYLFFAHDRHAGNLESAKQYLAWEKGLMGALSLEERNQFSLAGTKAWRAKL